MVNVSLSEVSTSAYSINPLKDLRSTGVHSMYPVCDNNDRLRGSTDIPLRSIIEVESCTSDILLVPISKMANNSMDLEVAHIYVP